MPEKMIKLILNAIQFKNDLLILYCSLGCYKCYLRL